MPVNIFDFARAKGTENKLGQMSAMGRYAIPEGTFCGETSQLTLMYISFQRLPRWRYFWRAVSTTYQMGHVLLMLQRKDDSSYVNGQNIAVDGGLSATLPVLPGRWA